MNFQELGLTLQRERERKGMSIEEVMEATKISRINIVALENGDRSSLPHPVYTKGFVKSYARYLGLDADELSMIVDREYQIDDDSDEVSYDVSPMAEKAFLEADAPAESKRSVWPILLISILLIAGVVFLLMTFGVNDEKEYVEPAKVVEETMTPSPEPVPEPEEVAPEDDGKDGSEASDVKEAAEQQPAPEQTPPVAAAKKPEAEPDKKVEEKPAKKEEVKPEKQKYDHVLIIRATTDKGCWIGVWRGNETAMARDFVLKEGEPLRLMFNNPRRIRIGNAAGVSVTYNGKPYPLNNAKGNIQTLRFGMN